MLQDPITAGGANDKRNIPCEIERLRTAWYTFMVRWRFVHYSLGIGGTVLATAVAARPAALVSIPSLLDVLAWFSAACIGVMTALRPIARANGYAKAWRVLNDACNRYALDMTFTLPLLLDAAAKGERLIQSSDPVGETS